MERTPRPGSRAWSLLNMKPGDSLYFKASNGAARFMQQIAADVSRLPMPCGCINQRHFIAVNPASMEAIDIVEVTRR